MLPAQHNAIAKQHRSRALALVLFTLIAIITLSSFAINLRTLQLLGDVFQEGTNWRSDFENTTQFLLARLIVPTEKDFSNFNSMDFFKLTVSYIRTNNNIVLWLALIEVALVNSLPQLRRIPKLRIPATICFSLVALATPIISRLSESAIGF